MSDPAPESPSLLPVVCLTPYCRVISFRDGTTCPNCSQEGHR